MALTTPDGRVIEPGDPDYTGPLPQGIGDPVPTPPPSGTPTTGPNRMDPNYMAPTPDDPAIPNTPTNTSMGHPIDLSAYVSTVGGQAYKDWQNQKDMMDWAKAQFAKNQGVSDQVVNRALDTSKRFSDWSQADRDLYEQTYVPAMKQQMDFARGYTTPERMAANRAGAMSQQNIAFDANADAARRQLQSVGVDPSSGRFAGLDAGLQAARAKAAASAGTTSDRQTEMLGQQYLANAIATGQVLPGQVVNEAGAGMAAGNQAVNTGLATTASGSSTMGTPLQWNTQGNQMIQEWPKALIAQTSLGMQQNKDEMMRNLEQQKIDAAASTGTGAAIGAGAGLLGGVFKGMGGMGGMGSLGSMFGGSGAGSVTASGPVGSGAGGAYQVGDFPSVDPSGYDPNQYARGGRVRRYSQGGSVFDMFRGMGGGGGGGGSIFGIGGASGEPWDEGGAQGADAMGGMGDMMGGMDMGGGEMGSPMGYITDAIGAGIEWGNGDQGETESPQTPMDPAANFWDSLSGKPRETYDEAERRGSKTGRFIGRFGSIFTGGMGGGAWAEGGGRLGGGIGAATEGDWSGAFDDVVQGTPLTFLRSAEGGLTPEVNGQDDGGADNMSNMVQPEQSPSGGAETDDVHALLNEGEFVVPKDVASWLGEKFLQNLINKSRMEASGPKAEPEETSVPQQAMALSPPSFMSEGARTGGMI